MSIFHLHLLVDDLNLSHFAPNRLDYNFIKVICLYVEEFTAIDFFEGSIEVTVTNLCNIYFHELFAGWIAFCLKIKKTKVILTSLLQFFITTAATATAARAITGVWIGIIYVSKIILHDFMCVLVTLLDAMLIEEVSPFLEGEVVHTQYLPVTEKENTREHLHVVELFKVLVNKLFIQYCFNHWWHFSLWSILYLLGVIVNAYLNRSRVIHTLGVIKSWFFSSIILHFQDHWIDPNLKVNDRWLYVFEWLIFLNFLWDSFGGFV